MNLLLVLGIILSIVMAVFGCKYVVCVAGVSAVLAVVQFLRGRLGELGNDVRNLFNGDSGSDD